jgi:hypothetical protein
MFSQMSAAKSLSGRTGTLQANFMSIMRGTLLSTFASAALVAAYAALSSGAASAAIAIVPATYEGTVADNYDWAGAFERQNADLSGDPFTVVYKTNDATPGTYTSFSPPRFSNVNAGSEYGNASPVGEVVTIKGHGLYIAGSYRGSAYQSAPPHPIGRVSHKAMDFYASVYNDLYNRSDPLSFHGQFGDSASGYVQVYDPDTGSYIFVGLLETPAMTSGAPGPDTRAMTSGVPELGTWAMMIIGFGGVGLQLRRRRRNAAVSG